MQRGQINIWRKLVDTEIYKDSEAIHLWVHLLINAKIEPITVEFRHKTFNLKRSQLVTTTTQLAKETGIDRSKIQRLGILLENLNMIKRKPENAYTVVTIVSYDKYQPEYSPNVVIIDKNEILTEEQVTMIMLNWKILKGFHIKDKYAVGMMINRRKELEGKSLERAKSILATYDYILNDDFTIEKIIEKDERWKEVMEL